MSESLSCYCKQCLKLHHSLMYGIRYVSVSMALIQNLITAPSSIFIISLLLIFGHFHSPRHQKTQRCAFHQFDRNHSKKSLGMEQLETSHCDLSISHEGRILEGGNLTMKHHHKNTFQKKNNRSLDWKRLIFRILVLC